MKYLPSLLALLSAVTVFGAPVPPAEKLLPQDTLAFITVPAYADTCKVYEKAPGYMMWQDPAMKPFKDKLVAKFTKDILVPLEKELGIKFSDYEGLAQGQFTMAVTAAGWQGKADQIPQFLFLMDSGDKSGQLKSTLANLKKKWVDAGKQVKSEKIRDVEFTTLIIMSDDLKNIVEKVFPDPTAGWESLTPANRGKRNPPAKDKENQKIEITFGQSDSLLIVGSSAKEIEKILVLQSGGGAKTVGELPHFQADYNALFRKANVYGWVNLKSLVDTLLTVLDADKPNNQNNPMGFDAKAALPALGLTGVKSAAFAVQEGNGGTAMNLYLGVPEAERRGLFKMFVAEAKDSSPPPFVPADAVKFTRIRLSFPKLWDNIEKTVNDINPALLGTLSFFEQALKQQDPDFTIKKSLIGNLGDDVITFEKNPRETTLEGLTSAPTLVLLGTPDGEKLATTIKALSSFAPMGRGRDGEPAKLKEREFQGRKIYSFPPMPKFSPQGQRMGERVLSFVSSGGYLALSTDTAMLEEYIRTSANPGKSLRSLPGLAEAAEKAGGMNTGMFGLENQSETMRVLLEVFKKDGAAFGDLLAATPFGQRLGLAEDNKVFKDWFDFALLPSWDKLSKYFGLTVYSGSANADGLIIKFYTPYPPQFR